MRTLNPQLLFCQCASFLCRLWVKVGNLGENNCSNAGYVKFISVSFSLLSLNDTCALQSVWSQFIPCFAVLYIEKSTDKPSVTKVRLSFVFLNDYLLFFRIRNSLLRLLYFRSPDSFHRADSFHLNHWVSLVGMLWTPSTGSGNHLPGYISGRNFQDIFYRRIPMVHCG